jgi:hypothetical protein
MSFTLIGPKSIHDNHFTSGQFFRMPEKYGLDCPVVEKFHQAHDNLHDVILQWDSNELLDFRQELLALRAAFDAATPEEKRGGEIYQTLVRGEEICREVMAEKDEFVFRWG